MSNKLVEKLAQDILALPNTKIVTIQGQKFDISGSGVIGYTPQHAKSFMKLLNKSIAAECESIVIRQFTGDQIEMVAPNGKLMNFPICNVYGGLFIDNDIYFFSAEDLKKSYSYDAVTYEPIELEKNVRYCEFPGYKIFNDRP